MPAAPPELQDLLQASGEAARDEAWARFAARFSPLLLHTARTVAARARNRLASALGELTGGDDSRDRGHPGGGERGRTPHSFTRVANFGGGILPILNTREDTRVPAPECLTDAGTVQIAPAGGSATHTFSGVGEQRYQCCFHPWMRTTVQVTESHAP